MPLSQVSIKKICTLLFLTSIVLYWGTLWFEFTLDDLIHVTGNPDTQSLQGGISSFLKGTFPGNLYRPVVTLSYSLTYALVDFDPWLYHLTNLVLNGAVVVLLFLLFAQVVELEAAAWIAILFAVHPLHTEVIANVHGRTELLAALFLLLTLNLILWGRFGIIAGVAFLFALLSKESAVVGIPLFLMLQYFSQQKAKSYTRNVLILGLPLVCYLLMRITALGSFFGVGEIDFVDNPLVQLGTVARVTEALSLLGRYATLSLFPYPLSSDYSFAVPHDRLFGVVLALLFVLTALNMRKSKEYLFALGWFCICFLVTSNIFFPIGTIFAERLAYLPSAGIVALLVLELKALLSPKFAERVLVGILIAGAGFSAVHMQVWQSNNALYQHQIQASPKSVKTQSNYAVVLRNMGDFAGALEHTKEALRAHPEYEPALFVESTIYLRKQDYQSAEESLSTLLKLNPQNREGLYALGALYFNQSKFNQAEELFKRLLVLNSQNPDGLRGMLSIAIHEKNTEKINKYRGELRRVAPDDPETERLLRASGNA